MVAGRAASRQNCSKIFKALPQTCFNLKAFFLLGCQLCFWRHRFSIRFVGFKSRALHVSTSQIAASTIGVEDLGDPKGQGRGEEQGS